MAREMLLTEFNTRPVSYTHLFFLLKLFLLGLFE